MLLIKNAKVYTMVDKILDNCDILINNDGKIEQVGTDICVNNVKVLDATGMVATPGLIDAHTHYGQCNYISGETNNNEVTACINPLLDARYSVNCSWGDFETGYKNGITSVCIVPGSANVIGGYGFAAKTYGNDIFDMIIKYPVAMKAATGGNPKGAYGGRGIAPMTNMAVAQMLEKMLKDTKNYINSGQNPVNQQLETMVPILNGEIPLKVHCYGVEMIHVLDICSKYNVKVSLEHASGAINYINEIVNSKCDVVFGPLGLSKYDNCLDDINACIELYDKNVNVSIMTDGSTHVAQSLLCQVGEVVRAGVSVDKALRLITINAAKNLGIDSRVGSLKVGKDADIVLFSGIPAYDLSAKVVYTIINGKVIYKNE